MDTIKLIEKAIDICGGTQLALAERTGLTQAAVSHLATGKSGVSAETAMKIDVATGGAVSRHDLRPDLYPRDDLAGKAARAESERAVLRETAATLERRGSAAAGLARSIVAALEQEQVK